MNLKEYCVRNFIGGTGFLFFFLSALLLCPREASPAEDETSTMSTMPLDESLGQTGTLTFELVTDKTYKNGRGQGNLSQSLLVLPGLMEIVFRRSDPVVNVLWTWEQRDPNGKTFYDIVADFSELPGPERYFFQFSWDSGLGVSHAFFNGQPLRLDGLRFAPWWISQPAKELWIGEGPLRVENLRVDSRFTSREALQAAVPAQYFGRHASLIGFSGPAQPIDFVNRRGALLYESLMDRQESTSDWVAEGPLALRFENGYMLMRSENFSQHTVYWCPEDFPESFVAEWEFRPFSHYGLAIIFFAARGEQGEDIFDPSLPDRDGGFIDYIKGAITSYHISYFANIENYQMGRVDSNMRKNNKFYKVGGGPIAVKPGASGWQHLRLIKDASRIQLWANGNLMLDWTDNDSDRYGMPHGGGKIGLRQMMPTVAGYRNFRVWELNPNG